MAGLGRHRYVHGSVKVDACDYEARMRTLIHAIPTFAELHQVDARFFRWGFSGTYRDELPEDLHRAFWAQPGNAAAMALLG